MVITFLDLGRHKKTIEEHYAKSSADASPDFMAVFSLLAAQIGQWDAHHIQRSHDWDLNILWSILVALKRTLH
jgi:hypothetical protein